MTNLFNWERILKTNKTTKQVNNSIWTNRKQVKFCFYLPIGPNKNCLIVWLFGCFLKSAHRFNKNQLTNVKLQEHTDSL